MTAKHTPGPWAVSFGTTVMEACPGGQSLAHVMETTHEEARANARLIAAAPDMLAALDALCECADLDNLDTRRIAAVDAARAAIAKARGE